MCIIDPQQFLLWLWLAIPLLSVPAHPLFVDHLQSLKNEYHECIQLGISLVHFFGCAYIMKMGLSTCKQDAMNELDRYLRWRGKFLNSFLMSVSALHHLQSLLISSVLSRVPGCLEVPSSVAFLVVTGNPEWCSIPCRGNTGHWIVSVRILKPVDQLIMPELSMNWIILIAIVAFLPKNEVYSLYLIQIYQCGCRDS